MADTATYAGVTLEQLEELSDTLVTRLTANLEDGDCLTDAYVLSRATLELIAEHRRALDLIDFKDEQIRLLRARKP